MLQHADDCTNFIKDVKSYNELMKEFENFGQISGSKINTEKTEILLIGDWRGKKHGLPLHLIKDKIKTLGINFGENSVNRNLKEIRDEIQRNLNIWAPVPICLMERAQIVKNFMYVHLNYKLKTVDISNAQLNKIDNEIIKYLWGFKMHYINKETLYKERRRGGLGLPNPHLIKYTNIINNFKEIKSEPEIAWQGLYIYFFGFSMKQRQDIYKNNRLIKLLEVPRKLRSIKKLTV